jgi:hypothetical protein
MSLRERWREFWRFKTPVRVWEPYEDDRSKRLAEAEVKLAFAMGFLRTIPGEDVAPEEAEAWHLRLDRFLTQDVHIDGTECR